MFQDIALSEFLMTKQVEVQSCLNLQLIDYSELILLQDKKII